MGVSFCEIFTATEGQFADSRGEARLVILCYYPRHPMKLFFLDDARQRSPYRQGCLVAVGGISLGDSAVGIVERSIDSLCRNTYGFPPRGLNCADDLLYFVFPHVERGHELRNFVPHSNRFCLFDKNSKALFARHLCLGNSKLRQLCFTR